MTKEEEQNLHMLEARVRQLISAYKALQTAHNDLGKAMEQKDQKIATLEKENKRLQERFDTLKTAKILEVSGTDAKEARIRLSKLIKEVDRCIALLNV